MDPQLPSLRHQAAKRAPAVGIIGKYLRIHGAFFRASFVAEAEFRANLLIRLSTELLWYLAQIVTFEVIFTQTANIGSWNLEKTRVFLGILFIADSLYAALAFDVEHLSDKVRKGDLDLLLVKPVSSQYMVSFQKVGIVYLFSFMLAAGWFCWALISYPEPLPWYRVLWLIYLIPCSIVLLYSIRFCFATVSVLSVRAENLQYLWYNLYRLGMRPDGIYQPWMRWLVFTIFPVGFIASVPARAVLEPASPWLFAAAGGMAAFCLWLSHRFWNFALSRYSSASS